MPPTSGDQLDLRQTLQFLPVELLRSVRQSTETRAMCFFLSSNVLGSHFEYLPSLFSQSSMDEHLSAIIYAVGLASFANEYKSQDVFKQARKQYIYALQLTNTALRSTTEAIKDSTLLAVMLLSLYETITSTTQKPLTSWTNHIKGATVLVTLRGRQQLRSSLGLQMFKQMTDNIIVSCIQREVYVPTEIIDLRKYAFQNIVGSSPPWRFSDVTVRFAGFCASIKDGSLSDVDTIIAAALKIDSEMIEWKTTLPSTWGYETIFMDKEPVLVYEGHYHLYGNHRISQMWNSLRMARIFLSRIISGQILQRISSIPIGKFSSDYTTLLQLSASTVSKMSSEICASVPQFIECPAPFLVATLELRSPAYSWLLSKERQFDGQTPPIGAAGGYFLLWPLFMAGGLPESPDSLRLWIVNRLKYIGTSMRIPQAILAAEILERKEDIEDWYALVFGMIEFISLTLIAGSICATYFEMRILIGSISKSMVAILFSMVMYDIQLPKCD
ncbi:hypothetical protein MMC15_005245 [Xylographa vitiligo]|nr:hypothetical protein [Xylographa vitiligo]